MENLYQALDFISESFLTKAHFNKRMNFSSLKAENDFEINSFLNIDNQFDNRQKRSIKLLITTGYFTHSFYDSIQNIKKSLRLIKPSNRSKTIIKIIQSLNDTILNIRNLLFEKKRNVTKIIEDNKKLTSFINIWKKPDGTPPPTHKNEYLIHDELFEDINNFINHYFQADIDSLKNFLSAPEIGDDFFLYLALEDSKDQVTELLQCIYDDYHEELKRAGYELVKKFPHIEILKTEKESAKITYCYKKEMDVKILSRLYDELKFNYINADITNEDDFVQILTSEDLANEKAKIYWGCDTKQAVYILTRMKDYFKNMTAVEIGRSQRMVTDRGNNLTEHNFNKCKSENKNSYNSRTKKFNSPKNRNEIDEIFAKIKKQ